MGRFNISFPFGALLRLAHAMQASSFSEFEELFALFIKYEATWDEEASADVREIWSELLKNAYSTHGPYGHKGRMRKLNLLVEEAIHLIFE